MACILVSLTKPPQKGYHQNRPHPFQSRSQSSRQKQKTKSRIHRYGLLCPAAPDMEPSTLSLSTMMSPSSSLRPWRSFEFSPKSHRQKELREHFERELQTSLRVLVHPLVGSLHVPLKLKHEPCFKSTNVKYREPSNPSFWAIQVCPNMKRHQQMDFPSNQPKQFSNLSSLPEWIGQNMSQFYVCH